MNNEVEVQIAVAKRPSCFLSHDRLHDYLNQWNCFPLLKSFKLFPARPWFKKVVTFFLLVFPTK